MTEKSYYGLTRMRVEEPRCTCDDMEQTQRLNLFNVVFEDELQTYLAAFKLRREGDKGI
jgi:hypothetical protein